MILHEILRTYQESTGDWATIVKFTVNGSTLKTKMNWKKNKPTRQAIASHIDTLILDMRSKLTNG